MKKYTIGVAIGNANSPHTRSLMRGIMNAAEGMNVNVMFFLGIHMANYYHAYLGKELENRNDYQYNVVYDYALLADVDAMIISYGSLYIFLEDQDKMKFLDRFQGMPYVLMEDRDESKRGTSIISDNYKGMSQVVEHLIEVHNFKKICFLSGPEGNTDADERKQAYLDVMKKHGYEVDSKMIEMGDFSGNVGEPVNKLLDNNPDMEAMVCANDVMTERVYYVCQDRGIVIGKDLAVTGYDDWDMAESMIPPLTTVLQNEFEMGYTALHKAYDLCMGKEPVEIMAPATLIVRASCGCSNADDRDFVYPSVESRSRDAEGYIEAIVSNACNRVLFSNVNADIQYKVKEKMRSILNIFMRIYESDGDVESEQKEIMQEMHELIAGELGKYLSPLAVAESFCSYSQNLIENEKDLDKVLLLSETTSSIQQYIQSSVTKMGYKQLDDFQQNCMFVPLISRDMMGKLMDEVEFYKAPMRILDVLGVKSAYLYILDKPVTHRYGDKWKCPKKIYLTSKIENGVLKAYEPDERPVVTHDRGMNALNTESRNRYLTTFNLFHGEVQYGLLVVEIAAEDMPMLHLAGLQISSAMHFKAMYAKQWKMQHKLEKLVEEVNEKNKILGFISEYDELTGCLNRRGFMERAMTYIRQHEGEKAILILGDLDHLKEINDCFGHVEGDFAIKKAAEILQSALGRGTTVARIGGDEFIAILPYSDDANGKMYVQKIKDFARALNEQTQKDYYIEMSAGSAEFICDPERDLNYIIADSDLMLYEAKRSRRSSIKKNIEA